MAEYIDRNAARGAVENQCVDGKMIEKPEVFRGSVNGERKYCRILVRRRRAPLLDSIQYFKQIILDGDEIINECGEEEQRDLRAQQACFFTALDAMMALAQQKGGGDDVVR